MQRRPRDTVSRRIGVLIVSLVSLLLLIGCAGAVSLFELSDAVGRLSQGYSPAADANSAALNYMLDAETGIRGYALTHERDFLQPYQRSVGKILPSIDAAATALHRARDHGMDASIAAERRTAQRWIDDVAVPMARTPTASSAALRAGKVVFDQFRDRNAAVARSLDANRERVRSRATTLRRIAFPVMVVVAVLAVLLAVYLGLRLARGVSVPLSRLWAVVRRVEAGDLAARADDRTGPVEVRELSAAVNQLAGAAQRADALQGTAERQRREAVGLTSSLRIGRDPGAMTGTLLAGLGALFDVDRVWFETVATSRVPPLAEQWSRDGRRLSCAAARSALHALAQRLWQEGGVISVDDHDAPASALPPEIAGRDLGVRASLFAALGDGTEVIGLLWLAMQDTPRSWQPTELTLLQGVGTELAQSLVQTEVLDQQRAAVRSLREADEAKTALVSTVSHELRTPLTSILGYVDLLLDPAGPPLPAETEHMLNVVRRNALRLRTLIEDLLTQSQIEAGRLAIALARIDLVDALSDVAETMAPLADGAGIDLQVQLGEPGMLAVDGDRRQLGQAVMNLVANAIKFTDPGGTVSLTARRERADGADWAAVEVRDTGMGIPDDEIPQLFDRFFRASNATEAVIPGTGLGLAIVREIVSQHHGVIQVESELGVGTAVLIRLPLVAPDPATLTADPAAAGTVEPG